jgi:hypothetical protein
MLIEFSDRAQMLVEIYLYDMYNYLTQESSDMTKDKLLHSATTALTQILTENSLATGYGEALNRIAQEMQ